MSGRLPDRSRPQSEPVSERQVVYGLRPVMELLERRSGEVDRVLVAKQRRAGMGPLLRAAREAGIPVSHLDRALLARQAGKGAVHQGVAAIVTPIAYADAATVCERAATSE